MKGTLTFCALACLAVWGGLRGWKHYQSTWPPEKAASWQLVRGNIDHAMNILADERERNPHNIRATAMLAECFDRKGDKHMAAMLYREALPYLEQATDWDDAAYHRERYNMLQMLGK